MYHKLSEQNFFLTLNRKLADLLSSWAGVRFQVGSYKKVQKNSIISFLSIKDSVKTKLTSSLACPSERHLTDLLYHVVENGKMVTTVTFINEIS